MSDATPTRRVMRAAAEMLPSGSFDSPDDVSKGGNIKVVCRFRPLNERERSMNLPLCVEFPSDPKQVYIHSAIEGGGQPLKFAFDYVFPPGTEQAIVYEAAARPTVESVLEGFNGTVFAYGQTGSGKTFTMTGADVDDERLKGIIPRMITTVFNTISAASEHLEFTVKVAFCEIYMEKIKDLLNPAKNNLRVHEDKSRGVFIADLTEEYVSDEVEVANLMKVGTANREVGFTLMNEGSSRSHSLFILTITQNNTLDYSAKTGKLYLVDLAGSEKVGKTGAEGKRLDEAKTINKSLSTLGLVINSLTDGKSTHVPYRDSKLTRVLQDSLGGNSKTALIITASPSSFNEAETISTLRFGIRAKAIKNKPVVNKEYTVAELKLMLSKAEAEIAQKSQRIEALETLLSDSGLKPPPDSAAWGEKGCSQATLPAIELTELQQEIEETRSRLVEQTEALEVANGKLIEAENKVTDLLRKREMMQEELNRMLNTMHALEEEKVDLEERNRKLAFMYDNALDRIETLGQMKEILEGKIAEQDEEIDRLTQLNRNSIVPRGTILVINDQLAVKDGEIREMKRKLETLEEICREIAEKTEDSALKDRISQVEMDEIGDFRSLFYEEKEKTAVLTEELAVAKTRLEEVPQNKSQVVEETIERLRLEAAQTLKEQLAVLQAAHESEFARMTEEKAKLLQEIEAEQINYKSLENAKVEEERTLRKKVNALERNLEQLTLLYQKAASQVSILKLDQQTYQSPRYLNRCISLQTYEKKLRGKDYKIESLRKELKQAQEVSPNLAEKLNDSERMQRFLLGRTGFGSTKIKKTIRGGKAQKLRVMGMFNPLVSPGDSGERRKNEKSTEDSIEEGRE